MSITIGQILKTPETFPSAQLVAEDFDDTVALTSEKSPKGIGVPEAYEQTVDVMFGPKVLDQYINSGGLQSRAPAEVVQSLAPDATGEEFDNLVGQFIDTKLSILMGEIGTTFPDGSLWPRPTCGYLELREMIEAARGDGRLIDELILSSGHEPFIKKTYEKWGVSEPTHIVAEEALRSLSALPVEQRVKPSPLLMDVARSTWWQGYGIGPDSPPVPDDRGRIVYVGDAPIKDGELAANSGVDFLLLNPSNPLEAWQLVASRLQLGHVALAGVKQRA